MNLLNSDNEKRRFNNNETLTNAKFQLGRFADKQVFPILVLALSGDRLDASNSQP